MGIYNRVVHWEKLTEIFPNHKFHNLDQGNKSFITLCYAVYLTESVH